MKIKEKYSQEINDISLKLKQLEEGRFTENTGANYDGLLATNVNQLKKMISKLLFKIETGADSEDEELAKIFDN